MGLKEGWYPQDDGRDRYWNGEAWTDRFRPVGPNLVAKPPAAAPARPPKGKPPGGAPTGAPVPKAKGGGCLLWVVGIGALLLLSAAFNAFGSGDGKKDAPDEYNIQATCQDVVRDQLKNPSTAEFMSEVQTSVSAAGTVVAENSLGGKVTSDYKCVLEGADMVRLVSFTNRQ